MRSRKKNPLMIFIWWKRLKKELISTLILPVETIPTVFSYYGLAESLPLSFDRYTVDVFSWWKERLKDRIKDNFSTRLDQNVYILLCLCSFDSRVRWLQFTSCSCVDACCFYIVILLAMYLIPYEHVYNWYNRFVYQGYICIIPRICFRIHPILDLFTCQIYKSDK